MATIQRIQPMAGQILIRELEARDLPGLEWEGQFTHYRHLYADAYKRAQQNLSVLWVAEDQNHRLIGQVFIQLICDRHDLADGVMRAYLYGFRTRPEVRSQGVGTQMVQVVENDLINRNFKILTLNVAQINLRAQHLYRRLGFAITAFEPGHWSYVDHRGVHRHVNEPAWRMEKDLLLWRETQEGQ